jgi:DNA-binding response OmpR family regulator
LFSLEGTTTFFHPTTDTRLDRAASGGFVDSQLAFIIEDDFDASQIFAKALEVQGLQTEIIASGDKAMERLREVSPYIIVLDLHLPNVDGTEILAWVRSMQNLRETLVMVVTADARMAELLQDQADLVLLKPATFTQIRDFTARLIRRRQAASAGAAASAAGVVAAPTELTEGAAPPTEAKPVEAKPVEAKPAETQPAAAVSPAPAAAHPAIPPAPPAPTAPPAPAVSPMPTAPAAPAANAASTANAAPAVPAPSKPGDIATAD